MPIRSGKDNHGCYVQWGGQKKYYYTCGSEKGRRLAREKAAAQARAAYSSGYKNG